MNSDLNKPNYPYQVRKAVLADALALADLIRDLNLFEHITAEDPQSTRQRVAKHLELCLSDDSHAIFVAEDAGGELTGYTAVHWLPYLILAGVEGYVSELFIAEAHRGCGLGAQLLEQVKEEAARRGCARLMLLNMRQRESYQRGFYQKHGWEERENAANFIFRLSK